MVGDSVHLLTRILLQGLAHLLEVTSVPVSKALVQQVVLLDLVFLSEVNVVHALEIARILGLKLSLNELLQSVWVGEESIVLDDLEFLALGVL